MTIRRNDRLLWALAVLLTVLAIGLAVTGCAAVGGTVATTPTAAQTQAVRLAAVRAADVVTTSLGILDETGKLLGQLPLSVAVKDRYDCAILAAVGISQPASPVVVRTCGAVPLMTAAPLPVALGALKDVSTCPGLRASLSAVYAYVTPLIQMLETSDQSGLRMAGASLRVAIGLLSSGGFSC